ncbi:uncharacterized protein M6B38_252710 [Iris pallida]|uniref:SAP domain-containing protein n=1 Tax=Iris pallida TaxID=29817 RepID=A0AAX6IJ61_IRIPA|nr:uncharacterized protein M6B38_252710 [Iris pallida]
MEEEMGMEMEMDLESMRRRDLQRLCQKHGIPSNSTNSAMIGSLRLVFQARRNSKPKGCLKGSSGSSGEDMKKVTFALDGEEGVENLGFGGDRDERAPRRRPRVSVVPVRSTRSRGLAESVLWSPVIEEKRRVRVGKQVFCGDSEEVVVPAAATRSLRNRVVEVGGDEQAVHGKRPRDASEAAGQTKKLKKEAKVGGDVTQAVRRATRSSSSVLDEKVSSDGETTLEKEKPSKRGHVNKVATEPSRRTTRSASNLHEEPVVKDKPVKQVKTGDSEAVTEPVRRLTRGSVNLGEDEVGKLGVEAVRKRKSKKQANVYVPERGESAVPVLNTEAVIPSTRRSTRSSSKLSDDEIPSKKQGKKHVSRRGESEVSVSDSEAVISPMKTTRSSSRLLEEEISLPAVDKPLQRAKKHVLRRGDSEVAVLDAESKISPMRTTRSSSLLLEDEKSLPVFGKAQQQAKKHVLSRGKSNVSVSDSEDVISPTKRSTRGSSKVLAEESSLPVVGKMGAEAVRNKSGKQAKKEGASKASLPESKAVNEPTRRTTRSSSMHTSLEDGTSLPVRGKFNFDTEAVKTDNSGKQAENHASNQGVSSALVLDSEFVAKSARRHTRRSAHNSSILGKPEVENKAVRVDKPSKRSKKRAAELETITVSLVDSNIVAQSARRSSRSSQKKLDDDGEEARSLRSRKGDEPEQVISLSIGGDSVNKAENGKKKKIQKQRRDQDLKEAASKASVSDSKRGAELEGSEVPKNIDEPPRRTTRSASKHGESHIMPVGATASDEVVKTSIKKKRTRAGALEDVSVEMREPIELGSLGIQNAGSRKSSRKSSRNIPTEGETFQRESSPETALRLLEVTVKASSVEFRTSGKQISSYKQSSLIKEIEDDQTLASSGNQDTNDHNIVGGDKANSLELHKVTDTTENVSLPFSGPAPSIDLSVAGETDDAGNEVNGANEKNVSELLSSPSPRKLLEVEKGTELEGSSNINQSSRVQEWYDGRKMTSSGKHDTNDHDIVGGDEANSLELHKVTDTTENVSLPISAPAPSIDLSVAGETDDTGNEVNGANEKNVSELLSSPSPRKLLEVEKGTELEGSSNINQSSRVQEWYDGRKMASSGKHDTNDHDIVGGDKANSLELHKVTDTTENVSLPISAPAPSIDLSVAGETDDAGNEVSGVNEKNVSELPSSPAPRKLMEVEKGTELEGSSNIDQSSCVPEWYDDRKMTSSVDHDANDHDIVGGDKANALELHEVVDTTENVSLPFPGPAPSIDLFVAGETDDAGNEVNGVNEKNVSELPSSPAPRKLLEVEKGNVLEVSSNLNQSSCVQEWHDDKKMTSSVNHETEDQNIISGSVVEGSLSHEIVNGSENVPFPESSGGTLSVDLSIDVGTDGAEIEVDDVIEGNYSQLQQSPVAEQIQVHKGILLEGPIDSEQQSLKQELEDDGKVASSGKQDLEDHNIVGNNQTGVAEAHKAIPILETETSVINEKSMREVHRSPVSIQLQEVENIISFEGAHNASAIGCHSYDPSICSNDNQDGVTGEISNIRRVSYSEMESSGTGLDGEPEKVAKDTPAGGSHSHLSYGGVQEVKETCQSLTSFLAKNDGEKAEAEVLPSSRSESTSFGLCLGEQVTDHGTQQAGLDCGSCKVAKETTCNSDSQLSGADTIEDKRAPILSLLERDGAETVGNQDDGEMGESSFHSEDMKSTAYSVITKGRGALSDAILYGDSQEVVEAKNVPALHLHSSGQVVATEISSSIAVASGVFSDQSRAVNLTHFVNNNSCDVTKCTIETEDASLVGTTEVSSLPYSSEASDDPSLTTDIEKVVHDHLSSACGPGGPDREAIMHSDQQRNPGDSSPDLASAEFEVDPQVTVGPAEELLDAKFNGNIGLADVAVEEIERREPLKGEASDDCEDLSVKELDTTVVDKFDETILEQGDASELQVPPEMSGEPQTSDINSQTFENPECQDSAPRENVLPVEDFSLSEKVENVPSPHKVAVILSDGCMDQENASSEEVPFSSEGHLSSPRPSSNVGEGPGENLNAGEEVVFSSEGHLSSPRPSANVGEGPAAGSIEEPAGEMAVLSPKPVSKLDNEKEVQEKSEIGIICNAHVVQEQEDRLVVTRDAIEDVSPTKAESLLHDSLNIVEPVFCSTSGSKYSKSIDTFQREGTGVYETSSGLYLNSIEKDPPCTGQSPVGQQEQITAGIEADSSLKNESDTHYKVDVPMSGMNQYEKEIGILEVEKVPLSSGQSLVGNQELTSIETEEVSAIEVGKASPQHISVGIKELSAIQDEKSSPTSVPSLVGLQVQTSADMQGFSAIGKNDQVQKAPDVKDSMALLFAPFHYSPREAASTGYTEHSEDRLDSWVFGDMTDGMDLTEASDEINYRGTRQDEVGVSNRRQGEFNRFEQSPVVSKSAQHRAEEAGPSPMYLDDLFCMDDEGTNIVNDSGHVGQWERRLNEEKSHFNEGENYLEVNSMKEAEERKEMKGMSFSRSFDAESEEALFFASETFAEAGNISASHLVQQGKSSGQGTNAVTKDEG